MDQVAREFGMSLETLRNETAPRTSGTDVVATRSCGRGLSVAGKDAKIARLRPFFTNNVGPRWWKLFGDEDAHARQRLGHSLDPQTCMARSITGS